MDRMKLRPVALLTRLWTRTTPLARYEASEQCRLLNADIRAGRFKRRSKRRHAAALALVGWYLMIPPIHGGDFNENAPISRWKVAGSYDIAAECPRFSAERIGEDQEPYPGKRAAYQFSGTLCGSDGVVRLHRIRRSALGKIRHHFIGLPHAREADHHLDHQEDEYGRTIYTLAE